MSKPITPILAMGLALGMAFPAFSAEPDAKTVLATVGKDQITLGHVIMMAQQLPQEYQALADDVLFDAVLDQLVRQAAVAQTVEGKLSTAAELALENEQRSFLAGEALAKLADEAVTDAAIQAAYDAQFAGTEPEREINAAHILVETEDKAKEVKALIDGGADFADMAREHSTGPSGPNGGDLSWFTKGMMVKPFEDAVFALTVGEVSEPVQTNFGWHIIKLNDEREKDAPALDDVRGEIAAQLQEEAVKKALEDITAAADVTRTTDGIDPALLRNTELLQN